MDEQPVKEIEIYADHGSAFVRVLGGRYAEVRVHCHDGDAELWLTPGQAQMFAEKLNDAVRMMQMEAKAA